MAGENGKSGKNGNLGERDRSGWLFKGGLILLACLLAHGLAFKADFYMDDHLIILGNQEYENNGDIAKGEWFGSPRRALPLLLFVWVYKLFGFSSMAFHALNFTLHFGISLLLFPVARDFLRESRWFEDEKKLERAALFAAVIFACHPLASEAVNYARCVMIQLTTLFCVLAAWMALKFAKENRVRWMALLLLFLALSCFSKEPSPFHCLVNVGIVLIVFLRHASWRQARLTRQQVLLWVLILVPVCLFVAGLSKIYSDVLYRHFLGSDKLLDHLLTQGRVFWKYMFLAIAPIGQASDHLIPWSTSKDTSAIIQTVLLGLTLLVACLGLISSKFRWPSVIALLIAAPLLLRFLFINEEVMVEYRCYPAMPWIAVALATAVLVGLRRTPFVLKYVVLFSIVGWVTLSALRSAVWQSGLTIASDVLSKYPDNNRARAQIQNHYYKKGDYMNVTLMRPDIVKSFQNLQEYNQKSEHGRQYSAVRAMKNVVSSEQIVAFALVKFAGPSYALAYADNAIERLEKVDPEFVQEGSGKYDIGKTLVEARAAISHYAAMQRKGRSGASDAGPVGSSEAAVSHD